jgi:hypothetical protein
VCRRERTFGVQSLRNDGSGGRGAKNLRRLAVENPIFFRDAVVNFCGLMRRRLIVAKQESVSSMKSDRDRSGHRKPKPLKPSPIASNGGS